MSTPQHQSTARQASAKQAAPERPPLREPEPADEIGTLLSFQAGFGNQVAKRAGDGCPNLAACPTGGACHECQQKAAENQQAATAPADGLATSAPAQVLRSAQDDSGGARADGFHDPEATSVSSPEATSAHAAEAVPAPAGAASPAGDRNSAPSVIPSAARDLGGGSSPDTPAAAPAQPTSFLVDDPASANDPAQVGKAAFLAELKSQVSAAAEEELAGTGRTAADCPWIQYWFGYFEHRSAERLEGALRRYSPEATEARDASEYVPPVVERVRRAVAHWVATGEVTGVPNEGLASLAQLAAATGANAVPASAASLFFKAREGGARVPADLEAMQNRLGEGEALDAPVRSRMESAFGTGLGGVRVHRDANAAALSSEVNARAFTLGDHVAFGAGEYRPGSVLGDALIAHELAHVVQQQGAGSAGGSADYGSLEADADRSAAGAVASLWSGAREGLAGMAARTGPALRSGLRLQRCKSESPPPQACAMPTAVRNGPFHAPIDTPDRAGMEIAITVTSSTGVDADMAAIQDSEVVSVAFDNTGSYSALPAGFTSSTSTFMPGHPIPNDRHGEPKALIIDLADTHGGNGSSSNHQLDIFKHPTCGITSPQVIPNSGYRIIRTIVAGPGTKIAHKTEKKAEACEIDGYRTAAGPSPTYSEEVVVRP